MNANFYLLFFTLFYLANSLAEKDKIEQDKMYILISETAYMINLKEDPIITELISLFPLKAKLIEEDSTSKHMLLNTRIDTEPIESSTFHVNKGDLLLFKGKELILLNESYSINDLNGEYIKIGSIANNEKENIFYSISKNKTIFLWNTLNYQNHQGKVKPYGFYNSLMNYFTWKIFTLLCFILI